MMPRDITIQGEFFNTEADRVRSQKALSYLLGSMVRINVDYLKQYPSTPDLYKSGVRYARETVEDWQAIPHVMKLGAGDCEDLACWRTAELIERRGVKARPFLRWRKRGTFYLYHVLVSLPDGKFEDPSKILGM